MEDLHNNLDKPFKLKLASGDKTGTIIIWNVLEASVLQSLQGTFHSFQIHLDSFSNIEDSPSTREIIDMRWHPNETKFLLSLHSPSSLILWNTVTGTKISFIFFFLILNQNSLIFVAMENGIKLGNELD